MKIINTMSSFVFLIIFFVSLINAYAVKWVKWPTKDDQKMTSKWPWDKIEFSKRMFDPFSAGFEWDDGMMNLAKRKWSKKFSSWQDLTIFDLKIVKSRHFWKNSILIL